MAINYRELKNEILKDVELFLYDALGLSVIMPKVFTGLSFNVSKYYFSPFKQYALDDKDGNYYFIYKITNHLHPEFAPILIRWIGKCEAGQISLACEFASFTFVEYKPIEYHAAINDDLETPWMPKEKLAPVYTLQKILKEYNVDIADNIPEAIYSAIIDNRRNRPRAPGISECSLTDIEIENLQIFKNLKKIKIELKFMDEYFIYIAQIGWRPDKIYGWEGKIEYMVYR